MIIYASNKVTPYVYLLTHKETNQFYIGSRFTKRQKLPSHLDILQYQTSSKTVKKMGFENFDVTIIAEFFCADDAFKFEQQLIEELWSPNCLNKYFIKSGINYYKNTGRTHSIETKQKISNARKRLLNVV